MGRKQKKLVFLYFEGHSEFNYFEGYRKDNTILKNVELKISRPTKDSSSSLFKHAFEDSKRKGRKTKDDVYCIMDLDNNSNNKLEEIESYARKHKINIIFSNPSFEIWVLLHYQIILHSTTNEILLEQVKKYIPNYQKNDPELYEKLKPNMKTAIQNSNKLIKLHTKNQIKIFSDKSNPCTKCNEIIEKYSSINLE